MGIKKKNVPGCVCCLSTVPPEPGPCCDSTPYEGDIVLTIGGCSGTAFIFSAGGTFDCDQLNGTFTLPRFVGGFPPGLIPCFWRLGAYPSPDGTNPTVDYIYNGVSYVGYLYIVAASSDDAAGKSVEISILILNAFGNLIDTLYSAVQVTAQDCVDFNFLSDMGEIQTGGGCDCAGASLEAVYTP